MSGDHHAPAGWDMAGLHGGLLVQRRPKTLLAPVRRKGMTSLARKSRARKQPSPPRGIGLFPTPEQERHTTYGVQLIRADDEQFAKKTIVNLAPSPLRAAYLAKIISPRQIRAGEDFERYHLVAWHNGGTRDPLDMTPRGESHETDAQVDRIIRAKIWLSKVENMAGTYAYNRLVSFVVHREEIKAFGWAQLLHGLTTVADLLGLEADEEKA